MNPTIEPDLTRLYLVSLLLLVGPLAAGALVGTAWRLGRGGARGSRLLATSCLLGVTAAVAALGPRFRVGFWDSLMVGALLSLGIAAGAFGLLRRVGRREALLAVVSLVVAVAGAEAVARRIAPIPPGLPPPEDTTLRVPRVDLREPEHHSTDDLQSWLLHLVDACAYVYPEASPGHFRERAFRPGGVHRAVLHLGDSMTWGLGVRRDQAFPALLEARDPRLTHVNLGVPGMAPDFYYAVARHWVFRLPVKLVVVHLYVNDVDELDAPMPCCGDRSLLEYRDGLPVERCPSPSWAPGYGRSLGWFVRHSPAPYPIRVAGAFSRLARLVHLRFARAAFAQRRVAPVPAHLDAILAALRDELSRRGIPLAAVVLPERRSLESPEPERSPARATSRHMKQVCESLHIPVFDPWDSFRQLTARDGAGRYFLGADDIHFSPEGHARLAAWLDEKLAPQLALAAQ